MSFRHIVVAAFVLFFLAACSTKSTIKSDGGIAKKSFESEDEQIIKALYFKENGDLNSSLKLFYELHERVQKDIYKLEIAELLISLKDLQSAESILLEIKNEPTIKKRANRLLLDIYLATKSEKKGEAIIEELIKNDPSVENYELASSVYLGFGNGEKALRHLETAYSINKDPEIAVKIADIKYIFISDRRGAISFLNTHIKIFGCERSVCNKLIFYQRKERNLSGLVDAYKMLYKETKEPDVAREYVEALLVKKEYETAQRILEESRIDDVMLLEIYKLLKKKRLALDLAKKLYKQTKEQMFLAEIAILEYELAPNRSDRDFLKKIDKMMSDALTNSDNDTYQNFLGYILIDHDYNIDKGIELVQKALNKKPDSPYYLDSLAWGYYKKKECKKAYEIIKRVIEMDEQEEPEIKEHWEKIKKCNE